jgi:sulfoxide reductase catalytic subunit YedY
MSRRDLPEEPPGSEVTPESLYRGRRDFLKKAGLFTVTAAAWGGALHGLVSRVQPEVKRRRAPSGPEKGSSGLVIAKKGEWTVDEEMTPYDDVTTYNNFYELGTSKSEPAGAAHSLRPRPWTVQVEGEVEKPLTLDIDAILSWFGLEERVYRMRCVEAWSMVIPWLGFPLAELVKRLAPTSRAKYVAFKTLMDPRQLPNEESQVLPWPYAEALRIDEATNPLALLAVGLYGAPLLGQNGAPLRLVVPWKYGFKGIKSIVEIRFTESRPPTTWNRFAPREYGFYANVNPEVDHPRWSQALERRIGEIEKRRTLLFNGYGEWVASLYSNLDLTANF